MDLDAIRTFPTSREVRHCGQSLTVSPFDIYADCPSCGSQFKFRAFSANVKLEDSFDAFFEWMNQPGAEELATIRRMQIENDSSLTQVS